MQVPLVHNGRDLRGSSDDKPDASDASDVSEADGADIADCGSCSCCRDPRCSKCMESTQIHDWEIRQERRWQAALAQQEVRRQTHAAEAAEWTARKAKDPSPKRQHEVTITMPIADARALLKRKGLRLESLLHKSL